MQQQEGKGTNNDGEKERKKKQRENRKKGRDNGLTEARILVVIPAGSNFKFKVPLNPTGKYKVADDSLPKRFETWLKKEDNNYEALLLEGGRRKTPLFEFKMSQQGSDERAAELEGPIGLWALD
jgi:hypothetical protein